MQDEILNLLPARRGHFEFESGHHGDLWLDLELLYMQPQPVEYYAAQLAARLARYDVEAVCGPLVEGAFVALTAAKELDVLFCYAERFEKRPPADKFFPVEYRIPSALRGKLRGKRVAIVNDVINAGSAVRGAHADLRACEAHPIVIGALAVLGSAAERFAADNELDLEALASLPNTIWAPADCPLCARQIPLSSNANTE